MGRIFTDAITDCRLAICAISVLAVLSYTKWHFWWRTGFGRTRMVLLLSIAALTITPLLRMWTKSDYDFNSIPDDTTAAIEITASLGVLAAVGYTLYRIVASSLRQARNPYYSIRAGRDHIARTPGATREDLEKLLACWDEQHSSLTR